ncbi:MAG TPA: adenylyl-sulfate kinase [Flavisolibacter sp.]|nr:adenylyl-sulfate kinase [Flavisolibacter sp.]
MIIIQLTGLSGAGKTTIANAVRDELMNNGFATEVLDGDAYRRTICRDLGFSKQDRQESVRRLGAAAFSFKQQKRIAIIAAINPYEAVRAELEEQYGAKTVWIQCPVDILIGRDTKGLYKKAMLPDGNPDKIHNLTGVNDVYEAPLRPGLIIDTSVLEVSAAAALLLRFILAEVNGVLSLSRPAACTIQSNETYKQEQPA